jgi:hypothetical protein
MFKSFFKKSGKLPRYHVSLYIIIPFIFSGFCILAAIVASSLTKYDLINKLGDQGMAFWASIVIGTLAFIAGLALVRLILKPVEQFVEKASSLSPISGSESPGSKVGSIDKIDQCFQSGNHRFESYGIQTLFPGYYR